MDIKDVLYWIFLTISIILLAWILFGDSPSEIIFVTTLFVTVFLKVWKISDKQIRTNGEVLRIKDSVVRIGDSIIKIEDNISIIGRDIQDLKNNIKK